MQQPSAQHQQPLTTDDLAVGVTDEGAGCADLLPAPAALATAAHKSAGTAPHEQLELQKQVRELQEQQPALDVEVVDRQAELHCLRATLTELAHRHAGTSLSIDGSCATEKALQVLQHFCRRAGALAKSV